MRFASTRSRVTSSWPSAYDYTWRSFNRHSPRQNRPEFAWLSSALAAPRGSRGEPPMRAEPAPGAVPPNAKAQAVAPARRNPTRASTLSDTKPFDASAKIGSDAGFFIGRAGIEPATLALKVRAESLRRDAVG